MRPLLWHPGGPPRHHRGVARLGILGVSAALALVGCAAVPDLGPRPETLDSLQASVLDGGTGQWPDDRWFERFGDPQLNGLVAEARAGSPTLEVAEARLHEAQARAGIARAARMPSIDLAGSVTRDKLSYNSIFPTEAVPKGWNDMGHVELDFSWELDFWGKNRKAFDAAVSAMRASDAEAAGARLMLTSAVVQTYLTLDLAFTRQDLARTALRNRTDSAHLVEGRTREGLDAPFSLEESAARVHLAEADLKEADENVDLARNALSALLGKGPDRGASIARPALPAHLDINPPAQVQADLLGRKPEVVAARWRMESAASLVGVARTAFYPNVNLKAFIGLESLGLNRLNDSGSDIGGVGPAFHLPIFEGGRIRSSYRAAGAEFDAAIGSYNEVLLSALREAADAMRSLSAINGRVNDTDAALVRSENAYAMARARYGGGLSDYQSVLTAEDSLLQTRLADAALRNRGLVLDVALVRALGGGYQSPQLADATRPSP